MADSAWENFVNGLKGEFLFQFITQDRDNYITFCMNNTDISKRTEYFLDKLLERKKSEPKSSELALARKNEGNYKLVEHRPEESVVLYTESIFYGPENDSNVPLSYSNRSLALFNLNHFTLCLQDIEMAMSLGYQDTKGCKLMIRKAEALTLIGEFEESKKVLAEVAKKPHNEKNLQSKLSDIRKLQATKKAAKLKPVQFKLPDLAGGKNKKFVNASNYITPHYSEKKGRHVIANHDIAMGDVLFVEKAYTFALRKQREACKACCVKTHAPIPCWKCVDASYCSPACRDEDWEKIHKFECGHLEALKYLGVTYLSFKIVMTTATSFEEFKKIRTEAKRFTYKEGPITFTSTGYEGVCNLIAHTDEYEPSELFHFVVSAILVTLYLKKKTNYFPESATTEDLIFVATAVFEHIMQMICNCYAIANCFLYLPDGKMVVTESKGQLGGGVYPSVCLMNHSCSPNVSFSFYKDYFMIRACQDIKKGEEILSCYGAYVKTMKRSEREEICKKQYFFDCPCLNCVPEFDVEERFTALKCPDCSGPLLTKKGDESQLKYCLDCKQPMEIPPEVYAKDKQVILLSSEANALSFDDVPAALRRYLACFKIAREIYYKFNLGLNSIAHQIGLLLLELHDYWAAVLFLRCSMMVTEAHLGPNSISVASESISLATVLVQCSVSCSVCTPNDKRERADEALKLYERAEEIYFRMFGPNYYDLDRIREKKRSVKCFKTIPGENY